jgi:hypothetical protein
MQKLGARRAIPPFFRISQCLIEHKKNFTVTFTFTFTLTYMQGIDKILETPRNFEVVLATLKELQLATLNILPFVYTL